MINSKILKELQKYFDIVERFRGKTIGQIKHDLKIQ
jgi:hypothetical protein